ncbi:MAG: PaaI family thioesterase, partial [Angustibacter sp.]
AAHVHDLAHRGLVDLHVHDYFTDEELWAYLQGLDVSVLPYRFGTHSGWLEACHDLGTWVVAPDCGFYAEQRTVLSYAADNALTFAAGTVLGPSVVTRGFTIEYLRPARGSALVARAHAFSHGARQAQCRCDVYALDAGEEVLVAAAQGAVSRIDLSR